MKPKQQEMDQVVKQVNEIILRQDAERMAKDKAAKPTLFVLLGDHAMNEIGNHGGNTKLETSTVFVFMGQGIKGQEFADKGKNALSSLLTKEVPQIDLVPTLSLLFGVPIPKNNLGLPLIDMLGKYSDGELLRFLQLSAFQMFGVVRANDPSVADVDMQMAAFDFDPATDCDSMHASNVGDSLRCKYMQALAAHHRAGKGGGEGEDAKAAERKYYQFMEHANEHLSRTFSGYDLDAMGTGIFFIGIAAAGLFLLSWPSLGRLNIFANRANWPAIVMLATHAVSVTSSSLIEEEHQYWYFWVQTMLVLRLISSPTKGSLARTLLQMCLFRVARAWNQTGQKWAGELDIRHSLNTTYAREMWLMAIVAALATNVWVYRLHIYLYPRPSRESITGPIDEVMRQGRPPSRTHKASAHLMAYRRDHELSERRRAINESARRVVTLYTGVETSEQRALVLGQRVFRALVAYASTCAVVYHLDRSSGWEALGLEPSTWGVVRKCAPPDLANVARMVYMCTGAAGFAGTACAWWRARSGFDGQNPGEEQATLAQAAALDTLVAITPLLMLLSRPHNIAVFALFTSIFALFDGRLIRLWVLRGSWIQKTTREDRGRVGWRPSCEITVFCLLNASFYVLGNSNSLASLDLSNAYAGVSRYNENLVGLLLFVANWAGPLWWAAASLCVLSLRKPALAGRSITDALVSAHLWQSCALLLLSIVVTALRTHLFIWSVFSPRYLYQIGWMVGFYTVCLTLGGIAWVAGLGYISL
ncbi:major facilitator super transporter protein [Linderina pennispora]|nr:major facilitator super transporter protein [Linderina pennispora]